MFFSNGEATTDRQTEMERLEIAREEMTRNAKDNRSDGNTRQMTGR